MSGAAAGDLFLSKTRGQPQTTKRAILPTRKDKGNPVRRCTDSCHRRRHPFSLKLTFPPLFHLNSLTLSFTISGDTSPTGATDGSQYVRDVFKSSSSNPGNEAEPGLYSCTNGIIAGRTHIGVWPAGERQQKHAEVRGGNGPYLTFNDILKYMFRLFQIQDYCVPFHQRHYRW